MSCRTGNLVGLSIKRMSGAWNYQFKTGGLPPVSNALALYMPLDEAKACYFVFSQREQGCSSLTKQHWLHSKEGLLKERARKSGRRFKCVQLRTTACDA